MKLSIPPLPKKIDKMMKEEWPHKTKKERQQMWNDAFKRLCVQFWADFDRRKKEKELIKKAFPLRRRGFFH